MLIELFDKVQLKNGATAHIVEVYEQGIAYEADIDEGDGEYTTDTIKHSDILYVFVEKSAHRTA
jgi:ABC-type Zn uptake system ZnuABC Zn-binding protein ZnuA